MMSRWTYICLVSTTKPKKGPDNNRATLALKALQAAAKKRMSQDDIADASGIPRGTFNSMMSNRTDITMGQFFKAARGMGYSEDDAIDALKKVTFQ